MKTVGIIGGIGPESTIEYYRSIVTIYRSQKPDGSYPSIIINSIAKAILTADRPQKALYLYDRGADFVFIPRMHSSAQVAQIIGSGLREGLENIRAEQVDHLRRRDEVLR
jgi:hypothetical protein